MKRLIGLIARPASNRRGATLAIVALGAPVLIGMVALGVDLGMMLSARAEAQRATDAGALAGAALFLVHENPLDAVAPAEAEAFSFTEANSIRHEDVDSVEITVEVNPDSQMVKVTATRTVPTWFAKIFGVNDVTVATVSVAHAAEVSATTDCVKPFALPDLWEETAFGTGTYDNEADLQPNTIWDLRDAAGNLPSASGNDPGLYENWLFDEGETYGGIDADPSVQTGWGTSARNGQADVQGYYYHDDFGRELLVKYQDPNGGESSHWMPFVIPGYGTGVSSFTANILECRPVEFEIGDVIEDEPGLYPNPTWQAMEKLLNEDPDAYWHEYTYQGTDPNGNPITVTTGEVRYPSGPVAKETWLKSPRVVTVPLVKPDGTISGKNEMEVADFAKIFLEWPDERNFKAPLFGRFLGFVPGSGGGAAIGSNVRVLRLIDEDRWVPYTAP
ncbi:MAG TPA: pilus assembly protein TadG-related protein [Longimicrobiales bacterium]|nr:pilus assembly protein TadG-related protein [Longimicrobiales bacterium]